jgi:hypothetical protein
MGGSLFGPLFNSRLDSGVTSHASSLHEEQSFPSESSVTEVVRQSSSSHHAVPQKTVEFDSRTLERNPQPLNVDRQTSALTQQLHNTSPRRVERPSTTPLPPPGPPSTAVYHIFIVSLKAGFYLNRPWKTEEKGTRTRKVTLPRNWKLQGRQRGCIKYSWK